MRRRLLCDWVLPILISALLLFGIYEGLNWIGIPDQMVTHGRIETTYFVPSHYNGFPAHRVSEYWSVLISTPQGSEWWEIYDLKSWEKPGTCVRVLYRRSRISHDFSASTIWREDCQTGCVEQ